MFFSAFDWNHNELQFFFFFSSSLCLNLNKSPTNFVLPQVKSCSSLPAAQRGNKLPHNVRHEYKTYLRSESKQLRPFDNSSADSGFVCRPLQASLFVHRRVPDLFVDTARVLGMSRTSETCRRWVVCHLDPCGRADVESIIQASSCTAEKVTNVSFPELWDRIVHSVQVRSLQFQFNSTCACHWTYLLSDGLSVLFSTGLRVRVDLHKCHQTSALRVGHPKFSFLYP